MTEEEKKAIEYLKARLYGNEGCKFIDVAQSDLRIFLNLVERQEKDIENWKKYCNEQDEDIIAKNNKICDLEFKVEKQDTEINKLNNVIDKIKDITRWLIIIPSRDKEGDYRPIKNTTAQECYKALAEIKEILEERRGEYE